MAEVADRFSEALRKNSAAISKGGAGLIAALVSFVAWKYINTGANPFKEDGAILWILIAATLVHLIFGFLMKNFIHSLILSFGICLVSGVIAIELLLYLLFTQIWKILVVNMCVALLVALVLFFNNMASFFSVLLSNCFRSQAQPQQPVAPGGEAEMTNAEESAV